MAVEYLAVIVIVLLVAALVLDIAALSVPVWLTVHRSSDIEVSHVTSSYGLWNYCDSNVTSGNELCRSYGRVEISGRHQNTGKTYLINKNVCAWFEYFNFITVPACIIVSVTNIIPNRLIF